MMCSIRDVAKLAGVSPATVSRVINGTANVDPEKRKRVLEAVRETGFVPNEVARTLFRKSAQLIGLIIPELRNPYFTQLAGLLDAAAARAGYRVFLCEVGSDPESIRKSLQMLISINVDGVVLTVTGPGLEEELARCRVPVVAVDCMELDRNVRAGLCCDYYAGGRLAMEHLLDCGCRKVVCIRGDQDQYSARMRYLGYRDVCRERHAEEFTVDCDHGFHAAPELTEDLLRRFPDTDGILACNDVAAIFAYKTLCRHRISVPEQVCLVGFDDIEMCSLMTPELTTVHQPIREMAEQAIALLLASPAGERQSVVFPVSLVIRQTTKVRAPE